jgi:hypothetical protein
VRIVRGLAGLAALVLGACASGGPAAPDPAAVALPAGYQGGLVVTPDPAEFPDTRVGCTRTLPLALANTRQEGAIAVLAIEGSSRALRAAAALPLRIPAGERRTLDLHFVPDSPGEAAGELTLATDDSGGQPFRLAVTASGVARTEAAPDPAALAPLDLVVALDVSTTMTGAAGVRAAVEAAFDRAEAGGPGARLGLVTFVNDVRVHGGGAFLARDAFLAELDAELDRDTGAPDPRGPRQILNFDFEEDVLGALHAAATRFPFRPEARRAVLLLTDATFLEPPAVFSDGNPASWSFGQVTRTLGEGGVQLVAVNPAASGRGLSSSYGEEPSLVARTGGSWFELADVRRGAPALEQVVADLVEGRSCD